MCKNDVVIETLERLGLDYHTDDNDTYIVDIQEGTLENINGTILRHLTVIDCGRYCVISRTGKSLLKNINENKFEIMNMLPVDLTEESSPQSVEEFPKISKKEEMTQSTQMFKKFAKAIDVLGKELGIGPLQNKLKDNGITWNLSGDKSAIIFYVETQGGKKQPVIKIPSSSLMTQSDFQQHLLNVLDFARGNAPGTFKQRKEELTKQENIVRDIARSVFPSDSSSKIANLMQ